MVREPTEAIISVTNRCDARCEMCNIWRMDRNEYLTAEDYRNRLPRSLKEVNLTGGEALLRNDIVDVAQAIYEGSGNSRIVLATNGFRTEKTVTTIQRIRAYVPTLALAVSLDGKAKTHDRMRGVPRSFERAVSTIRALKDIGIDDIRIGFTAFAENTRELTEIYELSRSLGVQFTATVAQNSDIYYGTDRNPPPDADVVSAAFGKLIRHRLHSHAPKDWLRAYFDAGVIDFVRQGKRSSRCRAGSDFFFLTPTGAVYPCLTLPIALGNLKNQSFNELWNSEAAHRLRTVVSGCQQCWMMCTARTELKRHPVDLLTWLVKAQLSELGSRLTASVS
jgi:MoaA/NifB/PqqE/SkfB family radical SAM enzyme